VPAHEATNVSAHQWISIAAAIAQLMVGGLVLVRGSGPLRVPLVLLCLDVAGWTAASSMWIHSPAQVTRCWSCSYATYQSVTMSCIDHVLTPLTAPLALDFVLVFVGIRRAFHLTRWAAVFLCGSLSLLSFAALLVPELRSFPESRAWGAWLLATSIPTMAVAVLTLIRHCKATADAAERKRTNGLLLVFGVGTLLGSTDVVHLFVPECPPLGSIGMLLCAIGMGTVTVHLRLLGSVVPGRAILVVGVVAMVPLCALAWYAGGLRAVAIGLMAVAAAFAAFCLARERFVAAMARAERTGQLATLGRFSAQMDHDVRNPLAALKGGAQLLRRDLALAEPAIDRIEFSNLIIDQVGRIEIILDRYRKLSRLELNPSMIELNDVVRAVLARQTPWLPPVVCLRTDLASSLPPCWADPDLLATIVESLTRNAVEAMPEGGTLTVATSTLATKRTGIELSMQDTGAGMDARTREQATDDFFTTKAAGSGFGLAFTKRVAEAHGGRLTIASQIGQGTLVRLWLPCLNHK
jgi:two-component system sensor histidine kinase HydH